MSIDMSPNDIVCLQNGPAIQPGPLLLTKINFNPSMEKKSHASEVRDEIM